MRVCVTTEQRFARTPDGRIWALSTFRHDFWLRYLEVFDEVKVLARICDVEEIPEGERRSDGPGVSFAPIPYYVGGKDYVMKAPKVLASLRGSISRDEAIILRLPSLMAFGFDKYLRFKGHPYGAEVRGDSYDVFVSGSIGLPELPFVPLGEIVGRFFSYDMRLICRHACAAAYVTQTALQERYPPGPETYQTYYSSIEIGDEAYVEHPRDFVPKSQEDPYVLTTMGSLEQMYKAPDVFIDAVSECIHSMGLNIRVLFMGSGKHLQEMKERAKSKGIEQEFQFLGHISGASAVREQVDKADLFVLPSRTEGLPRAMIEAMARGLPCIGTTIGGIPELLPNEDRIPVDDAHALAKKLQELLTDPQRMNTTAERNLKKSHEYHTDVLSKRRRDMYQHIKDTTLTWQQQKKRIFF